MASSYDKVVKLACKPKAAPPKAKYMDPIIAATWSEDGAVHDVCKALSPRFREPNAIIVFKALIVLHTMIRNGATDNVLQYLSSSDVLRLRNISAGHWEGYNAPQNLQNYSIYLDTRIRAYRDLKHDAIRVQSETNRDLRNSQAIEEGRAAEHPETKPQSHRKRFGGRKKEPVEESAPPSNNTPQRSKTIAGRKLRVMTVEKGLLRETKIVQKMIDALVECRFYLDDLEDELNITALRMLVKDILILFQACNEGVINVLEHYFEMSKIDAKEALAIYRHFCKETERVVEYLGVAKKLQNLLNVPIPNLRHAPVSLAGALEEYLNDPNFEQNRIEYKTNKEAADRNAKMGRGKPVSKQTETTPTPKPSTPPPVASSSTAPVPTTSSVATPPTNQVMVDFFSAIESEQETMFNPQTNSPSTTYFQQQAAFNPFAQQQLMTGQPTLQVQATGVFPQQQSINPFGLQLQQPQPFGNFLQPQPTALLQPQNTGFANPFRQSALFPQATGMPSFGVGAGVQAQPGGFGTNPFPPPTQSPQNPFPLQSQPTNPFPPQQPQATNPFPIQPSTNPFPLVTSNPQTSAPASSQSFNFFSTTSTASTSPFPTSISAFSSAQPVQPTAIAPHPTGMPIRPASAPLKPPPPSDLQPVKTHQTGSRNPFGVPVAPAPPVPKIPTMFDLMNNNANQQPLQQPQQVQPSATGLGSFNFGTTSAPTSNGPGAGPGMSNIASSFVYGNEKPASPTRSSTMPFSGLSTGTTTTGSTFTSSSLFGPLSSQPTATSSINTNSSFASSTPGSQPLKPQMTGFSGLKAFKPSSSFGAALLESLPPIPQSAPTTPGVGVTNGTASASGGTNGSLNDAGAGLPNTVGVGLRPQMTGSAGIANPFRASMFAAGSGTASPGGLGASSIPAVPGLPPSSSLPPFGGGVSSTSPFGSSFAGGNPGSGLANNGGNSSLFGTGAGASGANAFGTFGGGFGGNGQSGNATSGAASLI